MNIGEIIENWKKDFIWIKGQPNPFVRKEIGIVKNPANPQEVILLIEVLENTTLVDDKPHPYYNSMSFVTFGQNGTAEEREGDAKRLDKVLKEFMQECIKEREEEIDEMSQIGKKIEFSNPYLWI
jgi:hypothetical protein